MKKLNFFGTAGLLIALLGLFIVIGWYSQIAYFIQITCIAALIITGVLLLIQKTHNSEQALVKANEQLQESENRFRSAFDLAAVGMALLSPRGRYLRVNEALCFILGFSEDELLNLSIRHLIHPDDFKKDLPYIQNMLKGESKVYQSVQRYFNKMGEIIWIMMNVSLVRDQANNPLYFIAQFQDISTEVRSEERLRHMAYHDPLTGLANRNRLEQYINDRLISSRRNNENFSLIILDLDFFKNINDSIGHDAGDRLLQIVSERLKNTVRVNDMVARIGGDEFVIVITETKKAEIIAQIAQKILHNLLKPITLKGRDVYITTSIGISVYPYDGEDIETLMKNADLALYRAKDNGRNNYQFCTLDMTKKAQEKIERQNALNHALVKDEFLLYYQPAIDVQSHQITCVEALLRWQSKEFGLVMPDSIISNAEESGFIVPLSEWVIRTACKQVKNWQEAGNPELKLAINISPRQFKNVDFVENIIRALRESDFLPHMLVLEIKEGLIMHDPANTLETLAQLKEAGVSIIIDDFGTGFSSFCYLSSASVDKIKIDKSFIQQIAQDQENVAIVSAMIAMTKKLGIKSVAEGVETKEQFDILVKEGCDEIQGYYIARPSPIELMEMFLQKKTMLLSDKQI